MGPPYWAYTGLTCNVQNPLSLTKTRKRAHDIEDPKDHTSTGRPRKRLQSVQENPRLISGQGVGSRINSSPINHISHWIKEGNWPKELFQPDIMFCALAKKKSEASLRRKRSAASITTSNADQSAPYKDPSYLTQLEEAGSFMEMHELGISDASKVLCENLLTNEQSIPKDTIFCEKAFRDTCKKLRNKNEARIFKDITPLIVPSVEPLASLNPGSHLCIAVESVNEGWTCSQPLTTPRPQPDYAVGFNKAVFTKDQLAKLRPFLAQNTLYQSLFMGTYYMYFPFLTCEVKSGRSGLDIADGQNLHSMTLAVRAIVELFRLVNRTEELNREVLAFSVSHDQRNVRIYGHYPVIEGSKTTYWLYPLLAYDLMEPNSTKRWVAYTFTRNVYDIFMPAIFKRICSAIDALTLDTPSSKPSMLSQSESCEPIASSTGKPVEATANAPIEMMDLGARKKRI